MKKISYNQYKVLHLAVTLLAILADFVLIIYPDFYPIVTSLIYGVSLVLTIILSLYLLVVLSRSDRVITDELTRSHDGWAAQCAIVFGFFIFLTADLVLDFLNKADVLTNRSFIFFIYLCINAIQDITYLILERMEKSDAGITDEN